MFVKDVWQVAAFYNEITHNLFARTLLGRDVLFYRTSARRVVALENRCAHRYVPLSLGRLVGDDVQCGYHGLQFDCSGTCVRVPGQDRIPPLARVATFPIEERHGFVWIWMGDPALADPDRIPDFHWMTDPAWTISPGYHEMGANYQLLNDNLLDLSHETFVHAETIGSTAVADSPLKVDVEDGRVRAHRDMLDCEPPAYYVRTSGFTGRIDRWHTTFFTPPGFHLIENGTKPAGMDLAEARQTGVAKERRVMNLITPQTDSSSHYFWAVARNHDLADTAMTEFIRQQVHKTFDQDKIILEAQQRVLGDSPSNSFPVALQADVGAIQGRRALARILDDVAR